MKTAFVLVLCAAALSAQEKKGPLVASSQGMYAVAKDNILKSIDKVPDELWSFRPTKDVRTMGELFAHVADGQYEFCGAADGGGAGEDVEKKAKTKAEIVEGVKKAFAYCDYVYAKMNDENAADLVDFFGRKISRLGVMDYNIVHTMEHYGNLVTYMRMKGIVPPSSAGQQ